MPGEFVSEVVAPDAGTFDAVAMSHGTPGLPSGFRWRDRHYRIVELLADWRSSEAHDHAGGQHYYRKHFFRVRVDSGQIMTLYALRHVKPGASPRKRWWLFEIE